jgi:hypothetical protein
MIRIMVSVQVCLRITITSNIVGLTHCCPLGGLCCTNGYCAEPGGMCCEEGACPAGWACCGSSCIPDGTNCCIDNKYCPADTECILYRGNIVCCPNGICTQTRPSSSHSATKTSKSTNAPYSCKDNGLTVYGPSKTYVVKTDCKCPGIEGQSIDSTSTYNTRIGLTCTVTLSFGASATGR